MLLLPLRTQYVRLVIDQKARNVNSQAPQLVDMLTEIDDGATV